MNNLLLCIIYSLHTGLQACFLVYFTAKQMKALLTARYTKHPPTHVVVVHEHKCRLSIAEMPTLF